MDEIEQGVASMLKAFKAFLDLGTLAFLTIVACEQIGWISSPENTIVLWFGAVCLVAIGLRVSLDDLGDTLGWKEN